MKEKGLLRAFSNFVKEWAETDLSDSPAMATLRKRHPDAEWYPPSEMEDAGLVNECPVLEPMFEVMAEFEKKGEPLLTEETTDQRWPNTIAHICAALKGQESLSRRSDSLPARENDLFLAIANQLEERHDIRHIFKVHYVKDWLELEGACAILPEIEKWFTDGLEEWQMYWEEAAKDYEATATVFEPALRHNGAAYTIVLNNETRSWRFAQHCTFRMSQTGRKAIVVCPAEDRRLQVISGGIYLHGIAEHVPNLEIEDNCSGMIALLPYVSPELLVMQIKKGIEAPPPKRTPKGNGAQAKTKTGGAAPTAKPKRRRNRESKTLTYNPFGNLKL
ncbi:MAG: hypothetical protein U9Q03_04215 [Patescibacteria group bacterium]|nr:hypothetical protein [Patescibacteria group bacterium]